MGVAGFSGCGDNPSFLKNAKIKVIVQKHSIKRANSSKLVKDEDIERIESSRATVTPNGFDKVVLEVKGKDGKVYEYVARFSELAVKDKAGKRDYLNGRFPLKDTIDGK